MIFAKTHTQCKRHQQDFPPKKMRRTLVFFLGLFVAAVSSSENDVVEVSKEAFVNTDGTALVRIVYRLLPEGLVPVKMVGIEDRLHPDFKVSHGSLEIPTPAEFSHNWEEHTYTVELRNNNPFFLNHLTRTFQLPRATFTYLRSDTGLVETIDTQGPKVRLTYSPTPDNLEKKEGLALILSIRITVTAAGFGLFVWMFKA